MEASGRYRFSLFIDPAIRVEADFYTGVTVTTPWL
jgi:hypothetical protein